MESPQKRWSGKELDTRFLRSLLIPLPVLGFEWSVAADSSLWIRFRMSPRQVQYSQGVGLQLFFHVHVPLFNLNLELL